MAGEAHFERYRDSEGGWRYRLQSANGEIVIPPESVTRSADVDRAIEQMLSVVDAAAPPPARIAKITSAPADAAFEDELHDETQEWPENPDDRVSAEPDGSVDPEAPSKPSEPPGEM